MSKFIIKHISEIEYNNIAINIRINIPCNTNANVEMNFDCHTCSGYGDHRGGPCDQCINGRASEILNLDQIKKSFGTEADLICNELQKIIHIIKNT